MQSRQAQLVRASELYYERGLSQQKIADILGVSRPTVSRLLEEARKSGVVEIVVHAPLKQNYELSERLRRELGLKDAVVIRGEASPDRSPALRRCAQAAGQLFLSLLESGMTVGLSWGRVLRQFCDTLPQQKHTFNVNVVQTIGCLGTGNPHLDGLELTLALAKNHKTISGKVNLVKMLKETRDVRRFAMSPEQYQAFKKKAGKQKILFSAIRDTDGHGKVVDVIMPVTEIDRANMIFERIHYLGQPAQAQQPPREQASSKAREARERQAATQVEQDQHPQENTSVTPPVGQRQEVEPKKGSRSGQDLPATAPSSTSSKDGSRMTSEERPSVLERLKGYKAQLDQQQKPAPARTKDRQKSKTGKAK